MPTTTGDSLPYFQLSDQPDGASQSQAMMQAVQVGLSKRFTAIARQVARSTTFTMSTGDVAVATFPDGSLYNVGDLAYSSGIFTVGTAGLYRWDATITVPVDTANHLATLYIWLNGARTAHLEGSNGITTSTGAAQQLTAGGPVALTAGNTVQLVINYTGTSLAGAIPRLFSLCRIA